MTPTRLRVLVAAAVICAAIGWGLAQIVYAWNGRLLPVTWLAPAALWLLAAAVAYWTWTSRPRLQRRLGTRPLPPVVAARSAALAMADKLAAMPTQALVATRHLLRDAATRSFSAQLDVERDTQSALGRTHDYIEGVMAFREKRPARFKGA